MKTAVVILNWNGRKLLEQFLPGVVAHSGDSADVIVADNASTDDSLQFIAMHFPSVKVVRLPTNEGFAKGYNSVLRDLEYDYFLLLNSDVEVTPGWLTPLISYLDNHPATAVCQPKIKWQLQKDQFEYAGAAGGYIDRLGYPFCRGRIFSAVEKDNGQYENIVPVFWSTGACMLIRSEVFKSVNGFDELFFAHMEEIDLCWRIRNRGHEIVCVPSSFVYHVGGATLPKNNPGKTYLNFRNNLSMLYKNLPPEKFHSVIFLRLLLDGIAGIKFLLENGYGDFKAVFRAHMTFYSWIRSGKIRRNRVKSPSTHSTIYQGSIVWDHYILKKKNFNALGFHPGSPEKK